MYSLAFTPVVRQFDRTSAFNRITGKNHTAGHHPGPVFILSAHPLSRHYVHWQSHWKGQSGNDSPNCRNCRPLPNFLYYGSGGAGLGSGLPDDACSPRMPVGEIICPSFFKKTQIFNRETSEGAFIARAPDPERVLPICYLALGLANPVAFAATRIQTMVLAFPPADLKDRLTFRFALGTGVVLGLLPLIFILPGLIELYYITLQKLKPADMGLVRITAIGLIFYPFSVAVRAQSEGLAAWLKKPTTVMAGHTIFLATIMASGFLLFLLGAPGFIICATLLPAGSLASSATMRALMSRSRPKPIPIAPTTTSVGHVR